MIKDRPSISTTLNYYHLEKLLDNSDGVTEQREGESRNVIKCPLNMVVIEAGPGIDAAGFEEIVEIRVVVIESSSTDYKRKELRNENCLSCEHSSPVMLR